MPIRFTCPGCNKTFNAPDSAAGKQVKCPSCSTAVLLPGAAVAAAPAPVAAGAPPVYESGPAPQVHYHVGGGGPPAGPSAGMAIAGMVLGIVGFIVAFVPCFGWIFGIILGILGAVFSAIGLSQAMKTQAGKGMAITGLSLSVLAILWGPIWVAIVFATAAKTLNDAATDLQNHPIVIPSNPNIPNKP